MKKLRFTLAATAVIASCFCLTSSLLATETEGGMTIEQQGDGPITAAYTVNISSKELVLESPNDPNAQLNAMWDNPYQRIADRNMPWVEVVNAVESTSDITQYIMSIGDEAFHFSDAHFGSLIMESDTDSAGVSLVANVINGGDTLVIDIAGLNPGDTARFRVDIDPDDPAAFPHPDFRLVFFDMNGNSNADNSDVSLRFAEITDPVTVTLPNTLPDFAVNGPLYFNTHIRPYNVMEHVDTFTIGDSVTVTQGVPEPSTLALIAMLGLTLGTVSYRRRKSS